jgi:hypothetical protein
MIHLRQTFNTELIDDIMHIHGADWFTWRYPDGDFDIYTKLHTLPSALDLQSLFTYS